jgi:MFS transporter, Spinster family, sphingosine-1-phosphate transporter
MADGTPSGLGERVSSKAAPGTVAVVVTEGQARTTALGRGAIRNPAVVLALLTTLNLLNYVDRYVMSAVLPKVQDDLHLSNFMGGSLFTVFLIGYFATSPIFGILADRAAVGGRKRLLMLGVSIWSVATVASGLVHGTASLFAARAVVGVGEASYATIAPTLIDDLAAPTKSARWMAIFSAASPIGSALGYVIGGAVEHAHGWRAAFFVAGGPGIALALLCLLIAEPLRLPRREALRGTTGALEVFHSARTLLRIPLYRGSVLGYCAYTAAIGGFAFWAPKYLVASYGLDAGRASEYFGLLTVVSGLVGTLAGGWLADIAVRRGSRPTAHGELVAKDGDAAMVRGSLSVCALAAGLGVPLAAAAILATTSRGFFAFLVPCEIALFMASGPVNVALLRSAPAGLRASAMALGIFAIHLLGDLWSPPAIGLVADHAPMAWAMMAAPLVFAIAAFTWYKSASRLSTRLT